MKKERYLLGKYEIYRSHVTKIVVLFYGTTSDCRNQQDGYLLWFLDIVNDGRYIKYLGAKISSTELNEIIQETLTPRSLFLSKEKLTIFEIGSTDSYIFRETEIDINDFDHTMLPTVGIGISSDSYINDRRNVN